MHAYFRQVSRRLLDAWRTEPSIGLQEAILAYGEEPEPTNVDNERSMQSALRQVDTLSNLLPPEALEGMRRQLRTKFATVQLRVEARHPDARQAALARWSLDDTDFGPLLELGQVWDIVYYGLMGTADSTESTGVGQVVVGGEEHGADLGYGPIRSLTPEDVSALEAEVARVDLERFRTQVLTKPPERRPYAYHSDDPNLAEWALEGLCRLQGHYRDAAEHGRAILLYLA